MDKDVFRAMMELVFGVSEKTSEIITTSESDFRLMADDEGEVEMMREHMAGIYIEYHKRGATLDMVHDAAMTAHRDLIGGLTDGH